MIIRIGVICKMKFEHILAGIPLSIGLGSLGFVLLKSPPEYWSHITETDYTTYAPPTDSADLLISLSKVVMFFACAAVYFLPTIIAVLREKRNAGAIFVVNFFLGLTVLGWVLPLAWACMQDEPRAVPGQT